MKCGNHRQDRWRRRGRAPFDGAADAPDEDANAAAGPHECGAGRQLSWFILVCWGWKRRLQVCSYEVHDREASQGQIVSTIPTGRLCWFLTIAPT